MAVDPNSLSMAQWAVLSNDPLVQAVTFSLIDSGAVMQDIPFSSKRTLVANGVRWEGNLPSVTWGAINSEPVSTVGTPTPYQEQAFIIRNAIDVDKVYVESENAIVDPRGAQLQAYLKAVSYDFNFKFFKNDHVTGDANAIVGLRYRIDNGGTYGVRSMNKIDAAGVDMTQATLTTSTSKDKGNIFLELLDQLLWSIDGGDTGAGCVLYMNEVMRRRFATALRALGTDGGLSVTQDQFGRTVMKFRDAIIRDPGYKADQATRIITVTETANGAADTGGTFTSIYGVNYGMDHFFGWQYDPLMARDLGLLNNGVIYRTVVDWAGGVMNASNRSLGRIFDIKLS